MKIPKEDLNNIGLYEYPKKTHLFGDYEDIEFNQKTNELFSHNCIDGSLILYRKVKNLEDLKEALYDGFGIK